MTILADLAGTVLDMHHSGPRPRRVIAICVCPEIRRKLIDEVRSLRRVYEDELPKNLRHLFRLEVSGAIIGSIK